MGPIIIKRRKEILGLPSIRDVINKTRENANQLHEANNQLQSENSRFACQVEALADVEDSFRKIADAAGGSGPKLRALVKENGRLRREIEKTAELCELQGLYSAICQSDRDHDFDISGREVDLMLMRFSNVMMASETRKKAAHGKKKKEGDKEEQRQFDHNTFRRIFDRRESVPFMEVYDAAKKSLGQMNAGEKKRRQEVADEEQAQTSQKVEHVKVRSKAERKAAREAEEMV